MSRPRVVILGGGFSGVACAGSLGRDCDVTLVDRSPHFEFLPNIHELVSGVKSPAGLRLPLERLVSRAGHRFRRAEVEAIDLAGQEVELARGEPLSYDALVVGIGGINATHGVIGADRFALPFKTVDDCHRIGQRLAQLAGTGSGHDVVIVGGGLEGVEALGEVLRRYRGTRSFAVHLVDAGDRLLSELPSSLDPAVRALAEPHGVTITTGCGVKEVTADEVVLESGARLPADLTIWTGGPASPSLLRESGLTGRDSGWAPVTACLQSTEVREVFVVGDAALVPGGLARQAYHALDMGACAAGNVGRYLRGRSLRRFKPSGKPTLVSFGDLGGFLVAGDRVLAGPALAAAKEAVYELVMARLDARPSLGFASAAAQRALRAGFALGWPALRSPWEWPRLARLSLL